MGPVDPSARGPTEDHLLWAAERILVSPERRLPNVFGEVKERLWPVRAYLRGAAPSRASLSRFVIVTSGRTGSELLVSLLNSHPQILCDSELLNRPRFSTERLIEGRAAVAAARGNRAYGVKILPNHLHTVQQLPNFVAWAASMQRQGWSIIRLRRTNRIRQAVSSVIAGRTQHHYRGDERPAPEPVLVDPLHVMATAFVFEGLERQIDALLSGTECLEFTYEDDLADDTLQGATVATICLSLGLDSLPTVSDIVRSGPPTIRELVRNYDELATEIRMSRFAHFLDE